MSAPRMAGRIRRVREPIAPAPDDLPARPPDPHLRRQDFAARVIRRLVGTARVAVIDEHGRPAMVDCKERLFELLAKDHPIVGVYAEGARIGHVMQDLEAAGL